MKTEIIKWRILFPIMLAIFFLMLGAVAGFHKYQQAELNATVKNSRNSIDRMLRNAIDRDAELLSALTVSLKEDKRIQKAWLEKDRKELLRITEPIFEDLRVKYRVTHFYFHDTERICFLRVHNPPRFGDLINRFTMEDAVKKGTPVYGLELGPFGTFALRTVHPWLINGKLAGYIELGEEIEHLTPRLSEELGVELVLSIDKKHIDRSKWKEGLKMMGRTGNWDQFSDFIVIDRTIDIYSPEINDSMKKSHPEHADMLPDVESNSQRYRCGFAPLIDAAGTHVGDAVVVKDITTELTEMRNLTLVIILGSLITGGFLFLFFYKYVGSMEINLLKSRNDLKTAIAELEEALLRVKTLSGMLPICSSCKMIRDDKGYWNKIEHYLMDHSEAEFTHGICPECTKKLYPELYEDELE